MTNENYKGDDTGAYGNNFITINLKNPLNYEVSKAQFVVNGGCPHLDPVENPQFPMVINFTSEQTLQMRATNVGNLVTWDSQGRQKTCKGSITWDFKNGVIYNVRRNCC